MEWDQIERQWAAMTRRVQCGWTPQTTGEPASGDDPAPIGSAAVPLTAQRASGAAAGARQPVSGVPIAD